MKYYVYAGYYENFISGHKLPKPYTLRDEFKTFDEALDYVLENWEDDAIFFTEDVIGDAIDNGFINDEDWENYLMEESKNSTRKSIKESINANSILSKVETIVGKTKIKHPKAEIIELDGTKYIYYSYFDRGFDDDALDRVWDKCSDLKGVVDVGFGYGYGLENTKYENSLLIELDDDVIVESKKSARKSIKESINYEVEGLYFFNFDVGETCSIDLKDAFNADGVISEFYKNENRIYSIVVCSAIDYCFFISYDYRKKKVIYSECFSSYQNAKNKMRDWLKNI